jgi:hypothetical protein
MFEALMVGSGLLGFLHEIEGCLARWWRKRKGHTALAAPTPSAADRVQSTQGAPARSSGVER